MANHWRLFCKLYRRCSGADDDAAAGRLVATCVAPTRARAGVAAVPRGDGSEWSREKRPSPGLSATLSPRAARGEGKHCAGRGRALRWEREQGELCAARGGAMRRKRQERRAFPSPRLRGEGGAKRRIRCGAVAALYEKRPSDPSGTLTPRDARGEGTAWACEVVGRGFQCWLCRPIHPLQRHQPHDFGVGRILCASINQDPLYPQFHRVAPAAPATARWHRAVSAAARLSAARR